MTNNNDSGSIITPAKIDTGDFDPYSTDSNNTDHANSWHCNLIAPSSRVMNTPASINPFADTNIDWHDRERKMLSLMHDNHGLGLAAPQIGDAFNMFVMTHSKMGDIGVYNPEIVEYSDTEVMWQEGCLSFPLLYLSIKRPESINVIYTKADGISQVEQTMTGRDARIFLHEYDHLQGILFLDKVSLLKINRAKEQRNKLLKKFKKAQKNSR
jgi:peptide deformylase